MHNIFATFSYPIRLQPKCKVRLGPEESKDYAKQIKDLKLLRGHFLDIIISIEEKISLFLEKTLIPNNLKTKRVFTEKILHSKDLTLLKKIKLLKEIMEVKRALQNV